MADFTTLKTYTTQTATAAPGVTIADYVEVPGKPKQQGRPRLVELNLAGVPALAGGVAASAVHIDLWRLNRADATKTFVGTWTIPTADITSGRIQCPIFETWGLWLTVAIRFPDGTTPNFTGTVQARCLE